MNVESVSLPGGRASFEGTARRLFEGAEVRFQDEVFRRKSELARNERRRLYRMMRVLNLLVLSVGVFSGLLLAVAIIRGWEPDPARPYTLLANYADRTQTVLVILIVLCTVFASAMGRIMHEGDSLARYRKLRSEAETARTGRFTTLARRAAEIGPATSLEALEIIRADLLEDQRAYYQRRADQHRLSLLTTGRWTAVGIMLSALASMAAVTVLSGDWTQPLLVLGVIAAAVSAYAIDREGLNRDRANAELYDLTAERLGGLSAGVERVRAEIRTGNAGAVVAFADLVSDELQQEHRRWVVGLDMTGQLLQRLDERLAEARSRAEEVEIAPPRRAAANTPPAETLPAAAGPDPATDAIAPGITVEPEPAPEPPANAASAETGPDKVEPVNDGPLTDANKASTPSAVLPLASLASTAVTALAPAELAARVVRWSPVLAAIVATLPAAHAKRAQSLLNEARALATPLAAAQPGGETIQRAERLVALLEDGGPVSEWLGAASDVASLAMPPAAILLGAAGVAARLGEDGYRRWVAAVLDAPVPAALVRASAVDLPAILAALDLSPILGAAFAAERKAQDGPALKSMALKGLDNPDALWSEVAARFEDDRPRFDAGLREFTTALLGPILTGDLSALPEKLAGGTTPDQMQALLHDAKAAPLLRQAVLLLHEIRAEGGPAAADLLVAALGERGTR